MGNGHYPHEGFTRSAYVSSAQYRGYDNKYYWPYEAYFLKDKPNCYDALDYGMGYFDRPGRTFFFGGDDAENLGHFTSANMIRILAARVGELLFQVLVARQRSIAYFAQ
ncbi:hypothetical protein ACLOJK_038279 [Asimina triloba]